VAVVDAGTHLKAFSRMDGAVLGSIDIAMKKARTAALFQANSETVWEYCKPGAPAPALELSNDGLAPFGGGIPLRSAHGEWLGAVGVSGGAVAQDMEIAQAAAAALTQAFIKKWIQQKKRGNIVFTSSMGGLFTPPGFAIYVSTKHALEAIAEAMQQELEPFGIQVQTINPGAYLTGYNETMADTAFRWLDDATCFTKRDTMRATFDSLLGTAEGRLDSKEMVDRMIEIVPCDSGKFRNVVPQFVEDMLKKHQLEAWNKPI
jgi:uncharacterized protein GlcG (DUF336 family)